MKKKYIFLYFTLVYSISSAQNLHFQITDSIIKKPETVWIKKYIDGHLVPIDSISVSQKNKNNLQLNIGKYIGYVELGIGNTNHLGIPFIYNYNEKDFNIKVSLEDLKLLNYSFVNSEENITHNILLSYKNSFDEKLSQIRENKKSLNKFDSFYLNKVLKYESEFDALYSSMNIICDSILKKDNASFSYIIADFLKMPNSQSNTELKKYFDNYDALMHYHFFDYIDFSNSLILNYPALSSKINEYFSIYCNNNIDAYIDGVNILMSKIKNETVKKFVFNYLLNIFLKKKNDRLVTYLNEKYSDGCGIQLTADKLKEFNSIVQTQIGSKIPDILVYDSKNELRSLSLETAKNKYTIVYVWISSCHACQKKTPELVEIITPYLKKDVGVFCISVDDKKDDWLSGILKYKLTSFINVSELTTAQKSTILPKLNIHTTPKLYLIDKNGIIIAKDIYGVDLQKKLVGLFK